MIGLPALSSAGVNSLGLLQFCLLAVAAGSVVELVGLWRHAAAMNIANNEGSVSHYIQSTVFGNSYWLRNALLAVNLLLALAMLWLGSVNTLALVILAGLAVSAALVAVVGRALFYVLVVPTTMPGAFFWKNKDFEEHAREIGLANMPQVGVVAHGH